MFKVILVAKLVQLVRGKWRSIVTHNFVWYSPFGKHVLELVNYCIVCGTGRESYFWKS